MPRRLIVAVAPAVPVSVVSYPQAVRLVRTASGAYTGTGGHCREIVGQTRGIAQNVASMCETLPDTLFSGALRYRVPSIPEGVLVNSRDHA